MAGDRYVHCCIEDDATTLSIYIVQENKPNLRLASQQCEVLTFGSVDFSDLFHDFVEKRLLEYFDGVDHTSESILEEFAKVGIRVHFLNKAVLISKFAVEVKFREGKNGQLPRSRELRGTS